MRNISLFFTLVLLLTGCSEQPAPEKPAQSANTVQTQKQTVKSPSPPPSSSENVPAPKTPKELSGIYGTIVDATTSQTIAHADIHIKWFDNECVKTAEMTSNKKGFFHFPKSSLPSPVFISATCDGYWPVSISWRSSPVTLVLHPGDTVELRGSVIDEWGEPVPNAHIAVRTDDMDQLRRMQNVLFGTNAKTDENGNFSSAYLPAGLKDLYPQVQHDDFPKYELYKDKFDTLYGDVDLSLTISRGFSVSGRVQFASGVPIPNAYVWAEHIDKNTYSSQKTRKSRGRPIRRALCRSDKNGIFAFGCIPPSRPFVIKAAVQEFPAIYAGPWDEVDTPPEFIELVMTNDLCRLIGQFKNMHDEPITNVTCEARLDYNRNETILDIDEEGNYVSEYLLPGKYNIKFEAPTYHEERFSVLLNKNENKLMDVIFRSLPVITCVVKDIETKRPIENVRIKKGRSDNNTYISDKTDENGMFFVLSQDCNLTLTHPDYATHRMHLSNRTKSETLKTVFLSKPADVRVSVYDNTGALAKNQPVYLVHNNDDSDDFYRFSYNYITDVINAEDGTCLFTNVPTHYSQLLAIVRGDFYNVASHSEPFKPKPYTINDVVIYLAPEGALKINFSEPVSIEDSSCIIEYRRQYGSSATQLFMKKNEKEWYASQLKTGKFYLTVIVKNHHTIYTNVFIHPNETTILRIDYSKNNGVISGSVRYADGSPADCYLLCKANESHFTFRNEYQHTKNGVFAFHELDPNLKYTISTSSSSKHGSKNLAENISPNGPPLALVISNIYSVSGRVCVNDESVKRIEGTIKIGTRRNSLNSDGTFVFQNYEPGKYDIIIIVKGYVTYKDECEIIANNLDLGTIILTEKEVVIKGRLLEDNGTPAKNELVSINMPEENNIDTSANGFTDESGCFRIEKLPPDTPLELHVSYSKTHTKTTKQIGPFSEGTTDIGDIILPPPGSETKTKGTQP